MKYIKKNKFIIIILCIILLVLIASSSSIIRLLFPNLGEPIYGDRLDVIEDVNISHNREKEIANAIKLDENVDDATLNITGALVNIIIDVVPGVDIEAAKNLGVKTLMEFSDDEKKSYDIQVFITQTAVEDEDDIIFPIIGYKNKLSTSLVWVGKQ